MTSETPSRRKYDPVEMLVTIVDRGLGEKVVGFNQAQDVKVNMICLGRGTANSHILDLLGLGSTEKDVVLSFVPVSRVQEALANLSEKMEFKKPGKGIAFSIPINSIAGANVLHYFTTASLEEEE
ncbi:MAG TPA: hypothetical protein PKY19_07385 [Oscillospiraceae bacterium]|nr:hypothetical protein [Oscillospiraceae bacterium]HXK78284.1 hypothetical protein [Oscillospiraceae bacterium]